METQKVRQELARRLRQERPVSWEGLPDISLYMDQVISYLPRQLIESAKDDRLTSAMVNNYSKEGVLPRADGKKYGRTHLAYLTAVCALKQVLSVREMKTLLAAGSGGDGEAFYLRFREVLDTALLETADKLEGGDEQEDLAPLALELALLSYAAKLACQHLLEQLPEPDVHPEKGKRKAP
ncbi:hypothetical protein SDC9_113376 [bioreactor metagenome]|uniref:DUF1836 domain-containing protein n=1 Tax=bioreactor metagenome TaxID=1076179 RepID=A0A645BLW8_9ZZZZ